MVYSTPKKLPSSTYKSASYDDREKSKKPSFQIYFRCQEKGLQRIRAIEHMLRHPDGENAGQALYLTMIGKSLLLCKCMDGFYQR